MNHKDRKKIVQEAADGMRSDLREKSIVYCEEHFGRDKVEEQFETVLDIMLHGARHALSCLIDSMVKKTE